MAKLGWNGGGLGKNGDGITVPIAVIVFRPHLSGNHCASLFYRSEMNVRVWEPMVVKKQVNWNKTSELCSNIRAYLKYNISIVIWIERRRAGEGGVQ